MTAEVNFSSLVFEESDEQTLVHNLNHFPRCVFTALKAVLAI